mmetsp:Transcript_7234/g.20393  ORF Transcript_7234/g.20393 Transcript_7234/m.20393 type:complete len:522 (+) Transcript_7234:489-2054(+)
MLSSAGSPAETSPSAEPPFRVPPPSNGGSVPANARTSTSLGSPTMGLSGASVAAGEAGRLGVGGAPQISPLSSIPSTNGRFDGPVTRHSDGQYHHSSSDRRLRTDQRPALPTTTSHTGASSGSTRGRTGNRSGSYSPLLQQANAKFLKRASLSWILFFSSYVVFVVASLLLALGDSQSHITVVLLFSALFMLMIYGALLVRLTQPLSSWPGRLQICINIFVCILTSAVTWTVGTVLMIDILAQLSMVVMGVLLVGAIMFLGAWVRGAHIKVAERARFGLLTSLFPRHSFPDPAHGVPAVDVCCQWLGRRVVPSAWSENAYSNHNSLLRQNVAASDPGSVLTISSYLKCLWLHICSRATESQTTALLSSSPASRGHTLQSASGMSTNAYSRSGFPSSQSPAVSSVAHALVLPSRMSPSPMMRIGGMPFYENTPAEDSDNGHQYFCPICMLYYGEVYKTHCCNNYICQECSVVYVSGKRKKAEEEMLASLSLDYDSRKPFLASHIVDCPYCQVELMCSLALVQ